MIPFPPHNGSLTLEHNPHKGSYQTVKQYLDNQSEQFFSEWKDEASVQRAIETNELWILDWEPQTPVGSCSVAAPTLEELLEIANS